MKSKMAVLLAFTRHLSSRTPPSPGTTNSSDTVVMCCVVLAAVVMLSVVQPALGAPSCRGPGTEPEASELTCPDGVVADWCNRPVCGKGPGERCGGRWLANGLCGRGMFCACNHCHGCNTRLQCHLRAKC